MTAAQSGHRHRPTPAITARNRSKKCGSAGRAGLHRQHRPLLRRQSRRSQARPCDCPGRVPAMDLPAPTGAANLRKGQRVRHCKVRRRHGALSRRRRRRRQAHRDVHSPRHEEADGEVRQPRKDLARIQLGRPTKLNTFQRTLPIARLPSRHPRAHVPHWPAHFIRTAQIVVICPSSAVRLVPSLFRALPWSVLPGSAFMRLAVFVLAACSLCAAAASPRPDGPQKSPSLNLSRLSPPRRAHPTPRWHNSYFRSN